MTSIIRYPIHSRAFRDRARSALEEFDARGDVSVLLVAALHLRYGIEARLTQYLRATLSQAGTGEAKIQEYAATRLLARLKRHDPRAEHGAGLRITGEQDPTKTTALEYTPVTKELAVLHGRLGDLLHYSFFETREAWFVNRRSEGGGVRTIPDARDLVERGITGLTEATRGTLLTHPSFALLLQELEADDIAEGDSAEQTAAT